MVTVLARPVMISLWSSSVRNIVRVGVAVLDRYGLPGRLKWNIPLKEPAAFDHWLALSVPDHRVCSVAAEEPLSHEGFAPGGRPECAAHTRCIGGLSQQLRSPLNFDAQLR